MKSLFEAMIDPLLFGKTFGGPTFAAWRTVAKILHGSQRCGSWGGA